MMLLTAPQLLSRWMEDRQNTITQNNAYHQTKNEMNHNNASPRDMRYSSDCNGNSAGRLCDSRELCDESALFNRLTERITQQIRRDVKEEITNNINSNDVRYAMVEKMDKYLEAELHTHVCKICFGNLCCGIMSKFSFGVNLL